MIRPAIDQVAEIIHEEHCDYTLTCARWNLPESRHKQYYLDRAYSIITKLEPEIGIANVSLAVRVVLEELW